MKRIIHHNQVAIINISHMKSWFNIQKSINVTHYVNKLKKKKHMTISIDAEKIFDEIHS